MPRHWRNHIMNCHLRIRPAPTVAVCLVAILAAVGRSASTANAAETKSATLNCGADGEYTVTGFGRGNALHLTTGTSNFEVKYGKIVDTGQVITNSPGQDGRSDLLTCIVTSPVTGNHLLLRGFLTPH